jgi:hypothetical protein
MTQSRIPGAGYGLFGVKPRAVDSLLFKEAGEFVFVYATESDIITCSMTQISNSDCIWTNSRHLHMDWDPEALYFDPSSNRHYGKLINDHWRPEENSCEIRWNKDIRSVEVWSLVPIPLFKELETNYNDPYWYRPNNGLKMLAEAAQV